MRWSKFLVRFTFYGNEVARCDRLEGEGVIFIMRGKYSAYFDYFIQFILNIINILFYLCNFLLFRSIIFVLNSKCFFGPFEENNMKKNKNKIRIGIIGTNWEIRNGEKLGFWVFFELYIGRESEKYLKLLKVFM